MSWTEKRSFLPSFANHVRSSSHPDSSAAGSPEQRNVDQHLVRTAYLRKLKTMRKKWFALYEDYPGHHAHLEYHDNERKWRSGAPPKREIVLQTCLNICRKQDTRDSKHKNVIALYTLEDCVSILFEQEEEHKIWLDLLLRHQQGGRTTDGKIPKPNYEHMWQVQVKGFKPENVPTPGTRGFQMSGSYRVVVTSTEMKFFPIGSDDPFVFHLNCLRGCVCNDRIFKLETGRSSVSGPGTIIIDCEDRDISQNLNSTVLDAMSDAHIKKPTPFGPRSRNKEPRSSGAQPIGGSDGSRPRSSSMTSSSGGPMNHSVPKSSGLIGPLVNVHTESVVATSRYRTTSEGAHPVRGAKGAGGVAGSPMSPSLMCSSESAGSSNSITEDSDHEGGIGVKYSMTPDTSHHPDQGVIYEESSAESWVDYEKSGSSGGENSASTVKTLVTSVSRITPASTDTTAPGETASYTTVQTYSIADAASDLALSPTDPVHYSTIQNTIPVTSSRASSDYMAMTPTSRMLSETERLSILGVESTSASPSSDYTVMSPIGRGIPITSRAAESDYLVMSPVSASTPKTLDLVSKAGHSFDHSALGTPTLSTPSSSHQESSAYVVMSPVSVDLEKTKSAFEERPTGARPKQSQGSSKRTSFCSDLDPADPRWSPGPPGHPEWGRTHLDMDNYCNDPEADYVPIVYPSQASAVVGDNRVPLPLGSYHNSSKSVPVPRAGSRVSPASSSSALSGTPSSDCRFHPEEFHLDKVSSYLRQEGEPSVLSKVPDIAPLLSKTTCTSVPIPTSSKTRGIDIPKTDKLGKTPPTGQSPNLASRFDQWFRHRAGSVPNRTPFFERRRHRTQSEGEKDNEEKL